MPQDVGAVALSRQAHSADLRATVALAAARFACLSHHCPMTPEEAAAAAVDTVEANLGLQLPFADYVDLNDLAGRIVGLHTDPERLAVERIQRAIEGKSGPARTLAAYRANAGVLLPVDVERIAAELPPTVG